MKRYFLAFSLLLIFGCAGGVPVLQVSSDKTDSSVNKPGEAGQPREAALAGKQEIPLKADIVQIKIETTMGVIEAELYAKDAPKTVANFVKLAKSDFYDGIIFHRVIPDFMIQTGDPTGTGTGGPGYKFNDEFSPNLRHDKAGVLSMANSGPNTNGSQFFITDKATPWLDGHHSVFGRVTKGIDVVHAIAMAGRDPMDRPLQKIAMTKVTVLE